MNLTNKQLQIIEKLIADNIYKDNKVDFSEKMLEKVYDEIKALGIPTDKKFLENIFKTMIEKYESDPIIKNEIQKKESDS